MGKATPSLSETNVTAGHASIFWFGDRFVNIRYALLNTFCEEQHSPLRAGKTRLQWAGGTLLKATIRRSSRRGQYRDDAYAERSCPGRFLE